MKTKPWAIFTVIFTTLLTSAGQILYKKAADQLVLTPIGLLTNYFLIAGIAFYAIAGILMIVSLRGGEVSVLYPIIATSYIWVSFLSIYFLGESMNAWKWLGVFTIISGIILIGFGSKGEEPTPILEV
jgi:drug/metabolite transporter (DMT)-like permease